LWNGGAGRGFAGICGVLANPSGRWLTYGSCTEAECTSKSCPKALLLSQSMLHPWYRSENLITNIAVSDMAQQEYEAWRQYTTGKYLLLKVDWNSNFALTRLRQSLCELCIVWTSLFLFEGLMLMRWSVEGYTALSLTVLRTIEFR